MIVFMFRHLLRAERRVAVWM